jgi:hypothetical protein
VGGLEVTRQLCAQASAMIVLSLDFLLSLVSLLSSSPPPYQRILDKSNGYRGAKKGTYQIPQQDLRATRQILTSLPLTLNCKGSTTPALQNGFHRPHFYTPCDWTPHTRDTTGSPKGGWWNDHSLLGNTFLFGGISLFGLEHKSARLRCGYK